MILKIENVIKRFGNHLALDYLSLEVNQGEVIGLLALTAQVKQPALNPLLDFFL